jgi:ABC transport system ATP-binding/permease protein
MSRDIILQLKDICLVRGAVPIFSGVDLSLNSRERTALVGANGAGKSTLLQVMSGVLEFDKGERVLANGAHIAVQDQEPNFKGFKNLVDWVMQDIPIDHGDSHRDEGARRAKALSSMDSFGLDENKDIQKLSGGEARRAALARVFAAEAELMLLDEPTNHLDIAAIEELEQRLKSYKGAILLISHDRKFLENVSTSCIWLRNGKTKKLNQSFAKFDEWAEQMEAQDQKALEKLDLRLKEENHWLSRGVTARRTRNMGRLQRLYDMREQRVQVLASLKGAAANVTASSGDVSSKLVLEAKNVEKSFENRGCVVKDLSLRILRGDRIGIVGPNGVGKSTLIKMIVGELAPDSGNIKRAKNLTLAYLDQTRAKLDPKATLWETFAPNGGDMIWVQDNQKHVAAYAKDFLFSSAQLRQPVGSFSGGERNRVLLALSLAKASNFLVLDEPTNDLDMDTLDVLEEILANFDGTIILVSHDRAFLDNVVTSTLAPLGDGRWLETPGGWSDLSGQGLELITHIKRAPNTKKSAPIIADKPKIQTKLSYKDNYRLDELGKLMPSLEAKIAKLENELHDPQLYLTNQTKFEKLTHELDVCRQNLENMEYEWLELEEKKASLGA